MLARKLDPHRPSPDASDPWQLQDAKNRLSEVVDQALQSGPQVVTRRGEPVVVVVAYDTWQRKTSSRGSFKDLLLRAPLGDLDLSRDPDPGRDLDLG